MRKIETHRRDDVAIELDDKEVELIDVLYVPDLDANFYCQCRHFKLGER